MYKRQILENVDDGSKAKPVYFRFLPAHVYRVTTESWKSGKVLKKWRIHFQGWKSRGKIYFVQQDLEKSWNFVEFVAFLDWQSDMDFPSEKT